jgi:phosphatidylinositol kinase/protein kinase (PI-3  family)
MSVVTLLLAHPTGCLRRVPEPKIRETVFSCLKHGFDQYLVEPENLRLLFIALNDQVFKVGHQQLLSLSLI